MKRGPHGHSSVDCCETCKIRKIRCDGARPQCLKCAKGGRQCKYRTWDLALRFGSENGRQHDKDDGEQTPNATASAALKRRYSGSNPYKYRSHDRVLEDIEPVMRPAHTLQAPMIALQSLPSRAGHEFFVRIASPSIQGKLRHSVVLQRATAAGIINSFTDPLLFKLLGAIGTAWQAAVPVLHTTTGKSLDLSQLDLAFHWYEEVVRDAYRRVDAGIPDRHSLDSMLVLSILTVPFLHAIGALSAGLRSIISLTAGSYTAYAGKLSPGSVHWAIINACFDTVETWCGFNVGGRLASFGQHAIELASFRLAAPPHSCFASTPEACHYLLALEDSRFRVHLALLRQAEDYLQRNLPASTTPLSMAEFQCLKHMVYRAQSPSVDNASLEQHALRQCRTWHNAFDATVIAAESGPTITRDLETRWKTLQFMLQTDRDKSQMSCDRYADTLARVLSGSQQYLELRQKRHLSEFDVPPPDRLRAPIVLDASHDILRGVYIVCIKSRDSVLRRKAVACLSSGHWIEGHLNSEQLAHIGSAVIRLEEQLAEGLAAADPLALPRLFSHQIPERARFSEVVASLASPDLPTFELVCGRFLDDGKVELRTYDCDKAVFDHNRGKQRWVRTNIMELDGID